MKASKWIVCALIACGQTAWAQESTVKKDFNPHWFIQAQGGVSATRGEADFKDLISPAAALNVGYQFTPVIGLRVGASGWEAKGGWSSPQQTYSYNYVQGNVDVVFDLSALCCSYNPKRVCNLYGFVGGGVNYAFNNDDAKALNTHGYPLVYLWDDHRLSPVGRAGLGINLRVAPRLTINVEGNANLLSDHFNSKKADNPDWHFNLLAGLTIQLGKTAKAAAPTPVPAVNVVEPVEENKAEAAQPVPATTEAALNPTAETKVKPLQENIFFRINSCIVRTTELGKIEALVAYLRQHPGAQVCITGYADAATGTKAYNLQIATRRAKAVAEALTKRGIAPERIRQDSKGDTVQPFATVAENRVCICLAEE